MDKLKQIEEAILKFNINKKDILPEILKKFEEDFAIRFSHEFTKIEDNTLSIYEVKTLLVDHISVGGKSLREIYEVVNHHKAFDYVKAQLSPDDDLDENFIKDIHEILMDNIFHGGIYRSGNVRITGASFVPPSWEKVRDEMKYFIYSLESFGNRVNL